MLRLCVTHVLLHTMSIDSFFSLVLFHSLSAFLAVFPHLCVAQSTYMLQAKLNMWYTFVQKHQMENLKLISDYSVGFICLLGHLIVHFSSSHHSISTSSSIWARPTSLSVVPLKKLVIKWFLVKTTRWFSMRTIKIRKVFLGGREIHLDRTAHVHFGFFFMKDGPGFKYNMRIYLAIFWWPSNNSSFMTVKAHGVPTAWDKGIAESLIVRWNKNRCI